jgi:very-short-patch-repair endonuclease
MVIKKFKNIDELFQMIGTTPDKRNNLLEHIKRNDYLKNELYAKTSYLDNQYLVQPLSQRMYHYIHNMLHSVPTCAKGWYVRFKNFEEGYDYTRYQTVRNCEWNRLSPEEICKYVLTTNGGLKHPILHEWIKEQTKFLDEFGASIKTRAFYYRKQLNYPITDYKTGKLAYLFSEKQVNKYSTEINKFISLSEIKKREYFEDFLSLRDRERCRKANLIRFCFPITNYLEEKTKHLTGLRTLKNITIMAWHFVNNVEAFPNCKVCDKLIRPDQFNLGYLKYAMTCSHDCNNKCIEIIEKRLKNNYTNTTGYNTNVGENEKYLLTLVSRIKKLDLIYNKKIGPFFVDGFDPDKNLVVEIQEPRHAYNKQFAKDKRKIGYLLKSGYKILMVLDNWNRSKAKPSAFQVDYKKYFQDTPNVEIVNIQTINGKILTDIGWSNAMSIQKTRTNAKTLKITTNTNKTIECTEDHLVYSNETYYKPANQFSKGDYIYTLTGKERVKSVEYCSELKDVFDVIETENNTFFASDIKVHNCICLDEAAFIECVTGDTQISIKQNEQEIKASVEEIFNSL